MQAKKDKLPNKTIAFIKKVLEEINQNEICEKQDW